MEQIVHTDGFVKLVDHMPREDIDEAIVQAARVSYAAGTKTSRNCEGLIRYLLRHWHTTPFEMVEFKFHIKMPIFVARQHLRHRTASVNEVSARYSLVPQEYYTPQEYRTQSTTNHQGSDGVLTPKNDSERMIFKGPRIICGEAFEVYGDLIEAGCCRELARAHLPQSTYTEFYWKINLHNLMHYLHLRMDEHAQKEIQDYARAIYNLVEPLAPLSMKAFRDFRTNSMQLTGPEIALMTQGKLQEDEVMSDTSMSAGEKREFVEKLKRLGFIKNK